MTDLYVSARTAAHPGGEPVAGVHVSLHNDVVLASDLTDPQGLVFLGNRPAGTYEIRITPPAGSLPTAGGRQSVTVSSGDPDPVVFDVLVDPSTVTPPTNPTLCRCFGYFRDPSGRPFVDATISFSEELLPQLTLEEGVSVGLLPKTISVRTDADGYASVDLLRSAKYLAFISPMSNTTVSVVIPDLPTASLPDVLFAVVDRVEYRLDGNVLLPTSGPNLTIPNGSTVELSLETVYRSGYRTPGLRRVRLFVEDDNVVKVSLTAAGNLAIQAIAPGSAVVEVIRSETQEKTIYPEPAPKGFITVTVSP